MKEILALALVLVTANLSAQVSTKEFTATNSRKIKVGINFSPDYSYRTLKNADGSTSAAVAIKTRDNVEVAAPGFTGGLDISFPIGHHMSFQTGIQYSSKGYRTKETQLAFEQPSTTDPASSKSKYIYKYLDIPLKINYSIGEKRLQFITSLGITTNFLVNAARKMVYKTADGENGKITSSTTASYKKVSLSPSVSLGVNYNINMKSNLSIEPTFRFGVITITDMPVKEYLWNTGLNITYFISI